jgi:hypothetical protein
VEANSCPKARGLNRETIYQMINQNDTKGVITTKLLQWDSGANANYVASEASYNGDHYECYLCHRGFRTLTALNQHLASPAHKQRIYHCFGRSCGREFTALAQLFSHLESESCGATRFGTVQRSAASMMQGRMIAF